MNTRFTAAITIGLVSLLGMAWVLFRRHSEPKPEEPKPEEPKPEGPSPSRAREPKPEEAEARGAGEGLSSRAKRKPLRTDLIQSPFRKAGRPSPTDQGRASREGVHSETVLRRPRERRPRAQPCLSARRKREHGFVVEEIVPVEARQRPAGI